MWRPFWRYEPGVVEIWSTDRSARFHFGAQQTRGAKTAMAPLSSDNGESSDADGEGFSPTEAHPVALLQALEGEKVPGSTQPFVVILASGVCLEALNLLNSQDSGATLLENLYFLLKNISTVLSIHEEYSVDVCTCAPAIYGLVVHLSNWAFGELHSRFLRIISPRKVVPSAEAARDQFRFNQCASSSFLQDFCVLLRCCITMLHLLEFDFNLCMEKSQILVGMLRELCSPDVVILSLQQRAGNDRLVTGGEECFLKESSSPSPFLSSILEVCCKLMDMESPKLSLTAALALLGTPAISSAPYMLQSHMILLVSKCVAASRDLNLTAMNCFLSAFEQSVILYTCLTSHFPLHYDITGTKCQSRSLLTEPRRMENDLGLSFDCHVRKVTYDAVNLHSGKLVDHFSKVSSVFLSRTKVETVTICMTYIEENKHAIQEQWREETCLILNFIIQRIAGETGKGQLQLSEEINWQEVYYGGALLNLMGSSLLQVIMVLSEQGKKTLRDYDICRDYVFVSGVINLFGEHYVDQYVVSDIQAAYSTKRPQANLMLAHVTSLLFYAIDRRICPLWEGCILVMIAVMNLLVFEEGNLDAVRTMCGCVREISSSQLPASKISMGTSIRRSSTRIASDFQKIQFLQSKKTAAHLSYETSRMDISSSQTEGRDGPSGMSPQTSLHASTRDMDHNLSSDKNGRCNGEGFLKCILEDCSIPDWDDLANFIEATPERDYAIWLRKRKSYTKWKNNRLAVSRHRRKNMLQRMLTKCVIER
ncbi:hypothetical protein Taro_037652 [Colocasia esculenta]|uniref:DUF7812 domain-containing protein n=1 Tax=Colocasia esculenta TaxID=4460 RepID=A0A843W153_COLES|nr:hypothetical protein [Colocasia esculenta]